MLRFLQRTLARDPQRRLVRRLIGRYNPWDAAHRCDPYPTYRELRETAPIYRSPGLRIWMVSRYADAVEVLRSMGLVCPLLLKWAEPPGHARNP